MCFLLWVAVFPVSNQGFAADLEVGFLRGDPIHLQQGLNDAYAAFFDVPVGAVPGRATGVGPVLSVPRQAFDARDVAVSDRAGGDFYLRFQTPFARLGRLHLDGIVTATVGERRYRLDDGIGILTDPATIRFTAARLAGRVQVSAFWPEGAGLWPDAAGQIRLSASLGAEAAYIRTHFKSALIDRPAITRQVTPVLGLAAEWRWHQPKGLTPVLRAAADFGPARSFGLALGFGLQF